jgi:AcrR family transcriptional regulator
MTHVVSIKQANKIFSNETHEKIVDAVVDLITAESYTAATTRRIAEWAEVSQGVVQYCFGSKAKLFEALLLRSHERFICLINDDELLIGNLNERVAMFVVLS